MPSSVNYHCAQHLIAGKLKVGAVWVDIKGETSIGDEVGGACVVCPRGDRRPWFEQLVCWLGLGSKNYYDLARHDAAQMRHAVA